jgi:predicted ATPase
MAKCVGSILSPHLRKAGKPLNRLSVSFDRDGTDRGFGAAIYVLATTSTSRARRGQTADGLTVAEQAIERCEQTNERWLFAELLRIKGELMWRKESAKAEDSFREALDWARRQGALSWELRAATSLARVLRDQHRCAEAIAPVERSTL